MIVTIELLKTFPVFKSLEDKSIAALAKHSVAEKYSRRAMVLTAGKEERNLCFLFEGRMQGVDFTIDGREVGLYFVEPGDFCGELALFDNDPQPEHVIALTPSTVVLIPASVLKKAIMTTPAILPAISQKLASRVRAMTFQRSLLGLPDITQRVCCQLWLLVKHSETWIGTDTEIRNLPTHMEIAIMLNISRETVTRVFQQLQAKEIVRRDGAACLRILLPDRLKDLAEGKEEIST